MTQELRDIIREAYLITPELDLNELIDYIAQAILDAGYTKKPRIDEELRIKIFEKVITDYFILEKRWLRNKGRTILFGEDDSKRLAKALAESDILESGE